MWCKVNRLVALGVALGGLTPCFASADSSAERDAEAKRWSFAIALASGFTIQDHIGHIESSAEVLSFTAGTKEPFPPRPIVDGVYTALNPYFGANLEVMAPEIGWLPGKPRFFGDFEIVSSFPSTGATALEGSATSFKLPDKIAGNAVLWPQEAVTGTGSRLDATMSSLVLSAHIGVAFPTTIRGRLVRIKPTIGWIQYGVRLDGLTLDAYKDDPVPPRLEPPLYGENVRFIELSGTGVDRFNAIGPGLEIELEMKRRGLFGWGFFRPSIFLVGNAYRNIGNQTIEADDTISVNDALGEATYTTTWRLDVDDWIYRAGLGIRFRWVGKY
jgi:hypothetical protein